MVDQIMGKEVNDTEAIAVSTIPYDRSDNKALYLGYRSSGLTISESLHRIGCAHSTLSLWRKDPEFVALEKRIPEFRKTLGIEYANLEFLRNYRLVLAKDFEVIWKSLAKDTDGNPLPLTYPEQQYLLKARSHYTPQQLQIMEALLSSSGAGGGFDLTKLVIQVQRSKETMIIEGKRSGLPKMQDKDENLLQSVEADIV